MRREVATLTVLLFWGTPGWYLHYLRLKVLFFCYRLGFLVLLFLLQHELCLLL